MTEIRIAEANANRRGDLFCRLMDAYFFSLGYSGFVFNVHKAGREIDVQARHSTEKRYLRAECKATSKRIGGDEVNKFAGALGVEKKRLEPDPVTGYYVSLSGFKGTAIEQEEDAGDRLILITGDQVVAQLVQGRVLVPYEAAVSAVAKLLTHDSKLKLTDKPEVVATNQGWYWLVFFGDGTTRSHFAVVHGDGQVMPNAFVSEVAIGSATNLDGLKIISGPDPRTDSTESVRKRYFEYLSKECGHVNFEGLPVTEGFGARQLRLEDIYVPLRFRESLVDQAPSTGRLVGPTPRSEEPPPQPPHRLTGLSGLIRRQARVAILGPPGAGKSTLLKRIAIGFAFDDKEKIGSEILPKLNVLPLFVRCRQLNGLAGQPIMKVLTSIAARGGFADQESDWQALVLESIRAGSALLLIDGLDEISDEVARARFGLELQTFLAMYPAVRVVLTSREAGFRIVAPAIAGLCKEYQVAPLDRVAVISLTVSWSLQAMGESSSVRHDAQLLAEEIYETQQVRALATNPLLLTTLLLVRRRVGEIPKKRTVLYNRAIDVLLMTWNVEGHKPLDIEEAIPQLSYVAYRMLGEGLQTISQPRLVDLVIEARSRMPQILGFVGVSPGEFIARVEERSSLLSLSGHTEESGQIVPIYEFKHLSFQEYLAALALAAGYVFEEQDEGLPQAVAEKVPLDRWQEAISMAIVLSGMKAEEIVRELLARVQQFADQKPDDDETSNLERVLKILISALADEAMLAPDMATQVSRCVVNWFAMVFGGMIDAGRLGGVAASKFSGVFHESIVEEWKSAKSATEIAYMAEVCSGWMLARAEHAARHGEVATPLSFLAELLRAPEDLDRSLAAFGFVNLFYRNQGGLHLILGLADSEIESVEPDEAEAIGHVLIQLLSSSNVKVLYPVTWALSWSFRAWTPSPVDASLARELLVPIWTEKLKGQLRRFAAWTFLWLPPLEESDPPLVDVGRSWESTLRKLSDKFPTPPDRNGTADVPLASLLAAHYIGFAWATNELPRRLVEFSSRIPDEYHERYEKTFGLTMAGPRARGADEEPF